MYLCEKMATKVQKKITEILSGLDPLWLVRFLAIHPEISKSKMFKWSFISTHIKLFLYHRRRLHFLSGYLNVPVSWECPPFHAVFQKALPAGCGSQPLPPTFLRHDFQTAVQVSVTRWHQCTAIIKLPDKKESAWKNTLLQNTAFESMYKMILILSKKKKKDRQKIRL